MAWHVVFFLMGVIVGGFDVLAQATVSSTTLTVRQSRPAVYPADQTVDVNAFVVVEVQLRSDGSVRTTRTRSIRLVRRLNQTVVDEEKDLRAFSDAAIFAAREW